MCGVSVSLTGFCSPQRREERAGAGAAGAQEGGDPQRLISWRHRPGRPGEHALAGLLPGQEQADEGPAVGRVSDLLVSLSLYLLLDLLNSSFELEGNKGNLAFYLVFNVFFW